MAASASAATRTSPSPLELSRLGFGCWQLGSKGTDDYWGLEFTDAMADELVGLAVKNGILYMDTAEGYADGASEKQLGQALAKLSSEERKKVVIGTKILPNSCGDVRGHVEAMLSRLQVSCIDLVMIHWPITVEGMAHFAGNHKTKSGGHDYATSDVDSVGEVPSTQSTFRDLKVLQSEGKIAHIGVSNFGVEQLKEALATGATIAVNQICYNLIFRAAEFEVLPFCRENNIQVVCYSVLMQGILTGRYDRLSDIPIYRTRTRHFDSKANVKSRHGEAGHEELLERTLVSLKQIADDAGIGMSEMALSWPLQQDGVSCCVVGGTKRHHIEGNARAADLSIPQDVLIRLDQATVELKNAMGPNLDLWQGVVDGKQTSRCK